jgi:cytochrome c biogenesis protein CcmG/thiol:disulfide interchange protein DsbE
VRRSPLTIIAAAAVGIVVALLVVVLATRDPATDKVTRSPLVGKPAPAIRVKTIDGGRFDLDRYQGEFVLVNFFATWCVPCRQEHAALVDLSQRGDTNVVSVVFQDDPGSVRDFFRERGGAWPVIEDESGRITLDYGVPKVPESYLIAPDGLVVAKFFGVDAHEVTRVIDRFR